jgi:V/A-type H+-transporting ATPase subunit I
MKKVSLIMLENDRKEALKRLRKIGVIHLERVEGTSEELTTFRNTRTVVESALRILEDVKLPKKARKTAIDETDKKKLLEISTDAAAVAEKKKNLLDKISTARSELERFELWGAVNPADFTYLAEKGIYLAMYELPTDKCRLISDEVKTLLVNSSKSVTRFLYIAGSKILERPQGLPPEAFAVPMPARSTVEYEQQIQTAKEEIAVIDGKLAEYCVYSQSLSEFLKQLDKTIEFENLYSGMEREQTRKDTSLAWLTGFVPVDAMATLKKTAGDNKWAFMADDPADDDAVPTKLKNNKIVSLIYPLTDFLGTIPGYHEYDISGWFLMFFCLFFAMIFGDAGYGMLITVAALLFLLKDKKKGKTAQPMMLLMLLLGVTTVVWGTITCSWFGIPLEHIPAWIKALSFKPVSSVTAAESSAASKLVTEHLMIFCFIIAVVQLSVAHIKGIIRYRKSLKCLGELGSLLMLWGMYYVVLMMVVNGTKYTINNVYFGLPVKYVVFGFLGTGFLLSFVFSSYEGSLIASILDSFKNIISVLLGVVNVFSDIVSYIRLWAVSLAGSAISSTVNSMAGPTLGHAIMFLGIILLFFGHGLNLILDVLSVIVHGVRLNTLEFSSHLGMSWSGFKYEPFSETVKK